MQCGDIATQGQQSPLLLPDFSALLTADVRKINKGKAV